MRRTGLGVVLCLFWLAWTDSVFAAAAAVEVVKAQGDVTVSASAEGKSEAVSTKSTLPQGHVLSTGANGRAVVRVGNTGYIVLEKNSKVEIGNTSDHAGFLRHLTGMIYYAVNTLKGKDRSLEVRTKTATIGVRGTRFLVADIPDRNEIGMRKGTLSVTSLNDEFEIHKKSEQDEFEAFKQEGEAAVNKEKSDFEAYKEKTQREFVEYKREFSLSADRMVSFDGKRVDDRPLSGDTKKDMETLEQYAQEWLAKVKD